jgi:hypothetical protein
MRDWTPWNGECGKFDLAQMSFVKERLVFAKTKQAEHLAKRESLPGRESPGFALVRAGIAAWQIA